MAVLAMFLCSNTEARNWRGAKAEDKALLDKVASWQLQHPHHNPKDWVNGAFYRGLFEWADYSNNTELLDSLKAIGTRNKWGFLSRMYHADDLCVAQMYVAMYDKYGDEDMVMATKYRVDRVVMNPSDVVISIGERKSSDRWSWCDALFMAPPVYVQMYNVYHEPKYMKFLDREFKYTTELLFDEAHGLYFRDLNFLDKKEANGEPVFWGRGNGWVVAGLARILEIYPKDWDSYDFYLDIYNKMCAAILKLQDEQGSWHASLLDPASYPLAENSASGFMTYALAWGVNHGVLKDPAYKEAALKGWAALKTYVHEDGMVGNVQPIGAAPGKTGPDKWEPYGAGAFLLAGTQMLMMK